METDTWLKSLALTHPQDLLRLVGDRRGAAISAQVLELTSTERRVDCVIEVRDENATHYRHIEFQAEADPEMARRCFRYNSQLLLQLEAPVLTTVLYLSSGAGRGGTGVPRGVSRPRGQRLHSRSCALASGERASARERSPWAAGAGSLDERRHPRGDRAAAREITRVSSGEKAEQAQSTLIHLAGYHYTMEDLERVFGRRRMIQSSVWQAALAEGQAEGKAVGKAEGKAEGLVEGLRIACRGQVRRHHPDLLAGPNR